ncbi:hypothetical protein [Azospirillum palustre]
MLTPAMAEGASDSLKDQPVECESARDRIEKAWRSISHKYDLARHGSRKEAESEIVKITQDKDSTVHKYLSLIVPTNKKSLS